MPALPLRLLLLPSSTLCAMSQILLLTIAFFAPKSLMLRRKLLKPNPIPSILNGSTLSVNSLIRLVPMSLVLSIAFLIFLLLFVNSCLHLLLTLPKLLKNRYVLLSVLSILLVLLNVQIIVN